VTLTNSFGTIQFTEWISYEYAAAILQSGGSSLAASTDRNRAQALMDTKHATAVAARDALFTLQVSSPFSGANWQISNDATTSGVRRASTSV